MIAIVAPAANRNILPQMQRIARSLIEFGESVTFLLADLGPGRRPNIEDYQIEGAEIVEIPVTARRFGINYPSPLATPRLYRQVRKALKDRQFKALVTHTDAGAFFHMMVYWARRRGIPSIAVQEGMTVVSKKQTTSRTKHFKGNNLLKGLINGALKIIPHDFFHRPAVTYTYADFVCCYGQRMKDRLVAAGRSPETVFITGNPSMDHLTETKPVTQDPPKTVIYAHQYLGQEALELAFYRHLARTCCDELGYRLIFKAHPRSALPIPRIEQELRDALEHPERLVMSSEGDVVDMLGDAGVFITLFSNAVYFALIQGVPSITVSYISPIYELDFHHLGGARNVATPEQLCDALRDCMENADVRTQLDQGAERVIENHLHRLDGNAARRMAEQIQRKAT